MDCSTMLNKSGESGNPHLFLIIVEILGSFTTKHDISFGIISFLDVHYLVEEFPLVPSFLSVYFSCNYVSMFDIIK